MMNYAITIGNGLVYLTILITLLTSPIGTHLLFSNTFLFSLSIFSVNLLFIHFPVSPLLLPRTLRPISIIRRTLLLS